MDKKVKDLPVDLEQTNEAVKKEDEVVKLGEPQPEKSKVEKKPMLKKISKSNTKQNLILLAGSLFVVLAGISSGWVLSGGRTQGSKTVAVGGVAPGAEETAMEAGVENGEEYTDSAEGLLEEGGIDGEGTHHLVREGGPNKYVYMISTVIDLESFKGKTVEVWGETIAAQQAPWLMDVGKLKVIE